MFTLFTTTLHPHFGRVSSPLALQHVDIFTAFSAQHQLDNCFFGHMVQICLSFYNNSRLCHQPLRKPALAKTLYYILASSVNSTEKYKVRVNVLYILPFLCWSFLVLFHPDVAVLHLAHGYYYIFGILPLFDRSRRGRQEILRNRARTMQWRFRRWMERYDMHANHLAAVSGHPWQEVTMLCESVSNKDHFLFSSLMFLDCAVAIHQSADAH